VFDTLIFVWDFCKYYMHFALKCKVFTGVVEIAARAAMPQ
jgi:hypothetical protein